MKILFITPRFPYPPLKGDSLRTYYQLRALSREHEITLLSMAEAPVPLQDYGEVAGLCERLDIVPLPRWRTFVNLGLGVLSRQPMQVRYYQAATFRRQLQTLLEGSEFDVVHATLIRMLPYVWGLRNPPVVVDLIDSLGLNLAARRLQARGAYRLAYELEWRRVLRYERAATRRFSALVVSSPADREELGGGNVTVIPNGVDMESFAFGGPEGRDANTLVFTGNMGYGPNEEAVLWFASEVWPLLRAQRPQSRFRVVGTSPTERVRALQTESSGIEVLGRVPEITTYLREAAVAVCPMRSGSGIQNKVLEAMACGTPVVATSIANRGVGGTHGRDLLVADSAEEFAGAVSRLLDDSALRCHLGWRGRTFVEGNFRWEEHARKLTAIYETQMLAAMRPRLQEAPR